MNLESLVTVGLPNVEGKREGLLRALPKGPTRGHEFKMKR